MLNDYSYKLKGFLSKFLKPLRSGLFVLVITSIFIPFVFAIIYGFKILEVKVTMAAIYIDIIIISLLFISISLSFLIVAEVIFRILYYFFYRRTYKVSDKVSYKDIYVESHPYLPFTHKTNFQTEKQIPSDYPLHKGKYFYGSYTTNNLGFVNGTKGNRDVSLSKNTNAQRVNCVGASTTGNYLIYQNNEYSYPLELEKILNGRGNQEFEVNNCGQGGYNSADILIRFSLQLVETKPDVVILYHAYNDISAYLTPGFKSDYSHSRVNIGDSLWKFRLIDTLPKFPFQFLNYLIESWLPVNIRNSLTEIISKGKIDLSADPSEGLKIYRRNIQAFIDTCKRNEIRLILSTFCFFSYEGVSDSKTHSIYKNIVKKENDIIKDLALLNGLELVDNAKLVPQNIDLFVDSIHFTPEGMKLLASNFAEII